MRNATSVLAAVVAVCVPCAEAFADGTEVRAGAFIGGDVFGDNNELGNSAFDDQVVDSSPLFGLRFGVHFLRRFGIEIEGKVSPTSTHGENGRPDISATVLGFRIHGMIAHDLTPKYSVFGVVGVGGQTAIFDNAPRQLAIDSPDTDGATYWGVGATAAITDTFGARLDVRQLLIAGRDPSLTLEHEVHLGLYVRFGLGAPKTVVVERIVERPVEAPASPVETDSDGDGFPDKVDRCPNQAEVVNQIDDDDGCPEIDSDNDGLLGTRDQCPDAAEDLDGFEDDDGCPDSDNDGDGRPDRIDGCPLEPETLNGYQDDDGCPDEVPEQVKQFTGVIKGIRFKRGSARILWRSRRTLDLAVALFKKYPSLRIEISGHTDNTGSEDTNKALSRKRADAVKWYLVDHGIDPNRILTVGYGSARPIADNSTRKGRAQNRRIEFRLLPGPSKIELDASGKPVAPAPAGGGKPVAPAPAGGGDAAAPAPVGGDAGARDDAGERRGKARGKGKAQPAARDKGKAHGRGKARGNGKAQPAARDKGKAHGKGKARGNGNAQPADRDKGKARGNGNAQPGEGKAQPAARDKGKAHGKGGKDTAPSTAEDKAKTPPSGP
ncbi:MAG: hypothetical protein D6689_00220 [Deltaproteobacteria bacterium]|nr:MAG: hypothetical protein D6689_00220 [Deltaproteobacteria bacterium]